MSEEREYAKHVDELILNASADELLEIQKLDMETQNQQIGKKFKKI